MEYILIDGILANTIWNMVCFLSHGENNIRFHVFKIDIDSVTFIWTQNTPSTFPNIHSNFKYFTKIKYHASLILKL